MLFDIRRVEATASTNDDVKEAADRGEKEGFVVWAGRQTAGRGREGRAWESLPGNLHFSVLLRPPTEVRAWGTYSFAAGLAVAVAVGAFLPDADVKLKWPNDVLVGGKKISGILLEGGEGWLVAGIGINVERFPQDALYPATSLKAEGAVAAPEDVLKKTLDAFAVFYEGMNEKGFSFVREAWLARCLRGPLRVRLPLGGGEASGAFEDLDEQGNLCLKLQDGTLRKINAGDVFL